MGDRIDLAALFPVFLGAGAKEIVQETISGLAPVGQVSPNLLTGLVGIWGASAIKSPFWRNFLEGVAIASFADFLEGPIRNFWGKFGGAGILGGATTTPTHNPGNPGNTTDPVGAYLAQAYGA